jgi:NADPH:quinone reductase
LKEKNTMPKVVRFYELGGPDVLKVVEEPVHDPQSGEVRIQVKAFPLNRADVLFRTGNYDQQPMFPARIGIEAVGIVDAIAPDITRVKVGDRVSVLPTGPHVTNGEYAYVAEKYITPAPEGLSDEAATAVWLPYISAYGPLIEYANLQAGQTVVITAATSSVGFPAIQVVKERGGIAVATTRKANKKQALLDAGADFVIVTSEEDVQQRILELTNRQGADVVFDAIVGEQFTQLAQATKQGGFLFIYGLLDTRSPLVSVPIWALIGQGLRVQGFHAREIVGDPEKLARAEAYIRDGFKRGVFNAVIDRTFNLDEIGEAHRYLEAGEQKGKIVVTV